MSRFIKLTYYRPERQFGGTAGVTTKTFYCNTTFIERITPYNNSTKLSMTSGQEIEVCETMSELESKIKGS